MVGFRLSGDRNVVRMAGIFADRIRAVWIIAYIFTYLFGILFQYFTVAPMQDLKPATYADKFWFKIQIAMFCGFMTSYLMNW